MANKNRKNGDNSINKRFAGLIILCVIFVIISAVAISNENDEKRYAALKSIVYGEEIVEEHFDLFIDEESTLLQISEANGITLEKLCDVLNVDIDTDPNTKICELFERCED